MYVWLHWPPLYRWGRLTNVSFIRKLPRPDSYFCLVQCRLHHVHVFVQHPHVTLLMCNVQMDHLNNALIPYMCNTTANQLYCQQHFRLSRTRSSLCLFLIWLLPVLVLCRNPEYIWSLQYVHACACLSIWEIKLYFLITFRSCTHTVYSSYDK